MDSCLKVIALKSQNKVLILSSNVLANEQQAKFQDVIFLNTHLNSLLTVFYANF